MLQKLKQRVFSGVDWLSDHFRIITGYLHRPVHPSIVGEIQEKEI